LNTLNELNYTLQEIKQSSCITLTLLTATGQYKCSDLNVITSYITLLISNAYRLLQCRIYKHIRVPCLCRL